MRTLKEIALDMAILAEKSLTHVGDERELKARGFELKKEWRETRNHQSLTK